MKELEETRCEVRRVIELQLSIWDRLNTSSTEELSLPTGSPNCRTHATLSGGFMNDSNYVWLSSGPRFVVLNIRTGENISSWTFREKVTCVSQFPTQSGHIPLLLVGLDNGATRVKDSIGIICIFDCTTSRVLRAIRVPGGVEQVCVISGGAEWEDLNDKRTDDILSGSCGIACVVLRNLHHIILDLRRSLWEGEESGPVMDETCPTDIEFLNAQTSSVSRHRHDKGRHTAFNLMNKSIERYIKFNREEFEMAPLYEENLTTATISSGKIGCLISGCLGRVIIWQNDGSLGWISPPIEEKMAVSHLALLEPTDDPRPFYYLWVAYQEDSSRIAPILRMYALLFERKYCDKGTNLYFNLEGEPSLKFEMQLEDEDRITSLSPIERNSNHEHNETNSKGGEDSLLLIGMEGRALLFDLNQWYKEQLPRTASECQNPNVFLASYRMHCEMQNVAEESVLSCAYIPSTLREYPSKDGNCPEDLFHPNSLSLEWVELGVSRLTFWITRGAQWELLREMTVAGPSILIQPSETFHRCLAAGLVPLNVECSFDSDQNTQREMLLSLCLEQRWASFLIKCMKEWADGSVAYLYPAFIRWGVQRASTLKIKADQLCVPLFDQSGSSIGEAEMKTLRFCSQQLECLSHVVAKLPLESGDMVKQERALRRVATYLQVLLWFYDVGLLPETQEVDIDTLPISLALQIPYPYERLAAIYREKRTEAGAKDKNDKDCEENLFIDELMSRECLPLKSQWEREGGDISTGGCYPPPSLQSLLRSYLTDCYRTTSDEMENKHQMTIYLLMDLAMLLHGSCPGVNQLIKYPSAFKMSPSLIKLTQAFWHLDHDDYQGFLDMLTGQLVSDSDVKDWHHRLVIRTLIRNSQHKLALTYLRVRKPPLSSISDQSTSISLSVTRGMIQSAFHQRPPSHYRQLLTCFFQACKAGGKLNEILHLALDPDEEDAFVKFLEQDKCEETRLLYYLQRCRYTEANNLPTFGMSRGHHKHNLSTPLSMVNAYNATLPEVTRQFSTNLNKKQLEIDPEFRYPRPMSHCRSHNKNRCIFETVIKKARETYVRGERCQIPFVSAPCTSLKLLGNVSNTSCVQFPLLTQKAPGKRTFDEMQQDRVIDGDDEEVKKRRKISGGNDTSDKSDVRELGMGVVFDTPLVRKKKIIMNSVDMPIETPHSILKIRQLISSSTSSVAKAEVSIEKDEKEPSSERERRPVRQIRFSIGQPMNDSIKDESMDVTEKDNQEDDASEDSEEAFYSPNSSGKSHSTDSTYSGRSVSGPRPRPSLRMSSILSLNDSSMEWAKTPITKSTDVNPRKSSPKNSTPATTLERVSKSPDSPVGEYDIFVTGPTITPRTRRALNETRYTSSILSSGSSVTFSPEDNLPESVAENSQKSLNQQRDLVEGGGRVPLAQSRVSKGEIHDTRVFSSPEDNFSESEARESLKKSINQLNSVEDRCRASLVRSRISRSQIHDFQVEDETPKTVERNSKEDSINQQQDSVRSSCRVPLAHSRVSKGQVHEIRGKKLLSMECSKSITVSHSTTTKVTTVEELEDEEEVIMEVDDFGLDRDPEVSFVEMNRTDQPSPGDNDMSSRKLHEEQTDEKSGKEEAQKNRGDSVEQDEEEVERNREGIVKNNRGDIIEQNKSETRVSETSADESMQKVCESLQRDYEVSNDEMDQPEEGAIESDDYEEELSALKDKDEEQEDDNEEEHFQSLSNSVNSTINNAQQCVVNNGSTIKVSNNDSNITEDESSDGSVEEIKLIVEEPDSEAIDRNKKSPHEALNDNSNFTEDESSDSSVDNVQLTAEQLDSEKKTVQAVKHVQNRESDETSTRRRTQQKSFGQSQLLENMHDVTDTLEYSDSIPSPTSHNVTDVLEKLDRTKKTEVIQKSLEDDVFLSNKAVSTGSKASMRSKAPVASTSLQEDGKKSPESAPKTRNKPPESEKNVEQAIEANVRVTRSRRATSVAKDTVTSSGSESQLDVPSPQASETNRTTRKKRASSLVKEALVSSAKSEGLHRTVSSGSDSQADSTPPTKGRTRRSSSLAKEIIVPLRRLEDVPADKVESPLRRSSRRAASVQKEMPAIPEVSTRGRKTSTSSAVSEEQAVSESESVSKRTTRTRLRSTTSEDLDSSSMMRTRRGSSLVKETAPETQDTREKVTRKRGSSVPKETMPKTRRGSSLVKEVIPEEPTESTDEPRRGRTTLLTTVVEDEVINSPAKNTRSRRSSVQSLPEEVGDVPSIAARERTSSNAADEKKSGSRGKARERRAVSMEPSQPELGRKHRRGLAKMSIAEDTIDEEETVEDKSKQKTRTTKKASTRKRTESATSTKDDEDITETPRRVRKTSQQKNEEDEDYLFSPPEATSGPPEGEKEVRQVPAYVFSPPHTRSKLITSSQHRGQLNFLSPLTKEEIEAAERLGVTNRRTIRHSSATSTAPSRTQYRYTFHKRSKSASSD